MNSETNSMISRRKANTHFDEPMIYDRRWLATLFMQIINMLASC